mgnify:FL=1
MNADRIIVVKDGEIVEQGNHEELIRANGKYADLWSKQVFIRSKNRDQSTDDESTSSIVNDLTPEKAKTELSKVKSSIINGEASNSANGVAKNSEQSNTKPGNGTAKVNNGNTAASANHKKEV